MAKKKINKSRWYVPKIIFAFLLLISGFVTLLAPVSLVGLLLIWWWMKKFLWLKIVLTILFVPLAGIFMYVLLVLPRTDFLFTGKLLESYGFTQDPLDSQNIAIPYYRKDTNKVYLYNGSRSILLADFSRNDFKKSLNGETFTDLENVYISLASSMAILSVQHTEKNTWPQEDFYFSTLDGSGKLVPMDPHVRDSIPAIENNSCLHNKILYYVTLSDYTIVGENLLTNKITTIYRMPQGDLSGVMGCMKDGIVFYETNQDYSNTIYKLSFDGKHKEILAEGVDANSDFNWSADSGAYSYLFYDPNHSNDLHNFNTYKFGKFGDSLVLGLPCSNNQCSALLFSPDGKYIIIGYDEYYAIFDTSVHKAIGLIPIPGDISNIFWLDSGHIIYSYYSDIKKLHEYTIATKKTSVYFDNKSPMYIIRTNSKLHKIIFSNPENNEGLGIALRPAINVYQLTY